MQNNPSLFVVRQISQQIENALPGIIPPLHFGAHCRGLFGLGISELSFIYAKYVANTDLLSVRDYLVTLHWLKTYPEWRPGVYF